MVSISYEGSLQLTEALFYAGANKNHMIEALLFASKKLDCVKFLLDSGVFTNEEITKALYYVSKKAGKDISLLEILIEKTKENNIDINIPDLGGLTALDYGITNFFGGTIKPLLDAGGKTNVNSEGLAAYKIKVCIFNMNYNFYGYMFAQFLLTPGIKYVTDIINKDNSDATFFSYYQSTFNSCNKIILKIGLSTIFFGSSYYYNNFNLFNSIIISKLASDTVELLISDDSMNVDPKNHAYETLGYLVKIGTINLIKEYHSADNNFASAVLAYTSPALIDLIASVVYQGALEVYEILNPNGDHIDFDYYLW